MLSEWDLNLKKMYEARKQQMHLQEDALQKSFIEEAIICNQNPTSSLKQPTRPTAEQPTTQDLPKEERSLNNKLAKEADSDPRLVEDTQMT